MGLQKLERELFVRLFNRGGYVLDFSTADFDAFTRDSVGVELCAKYGLSKGKSLLQFTREGDGVLVDKLLLDLLNYYELSYPQFESETDSNSSNSSYGVNYSTTYRKCKELADKLTSSDQYIETSAQIITRAFSSDYIDDQVQIMLSMQKENPTEAIGKAKELIESCCKAIYENNNVSYDKNWDVPRLTHETLKLLEITPAHIPDTAKEAKSMKAILGNLFQIAHNIAELRNAYGSGHGKSPNYKGLEERHAKLAVGSALTLVNFMWDSYLRQSRNKDV